MKRPVDNFQRALIASGTRIFAEGEVAERAYLLNSGEVEISTVRDGATIVLTRIRPGQIFGELALIDDSRRSATATAASDCELTVVPAEAFYKHLDRLDEFVAALVRHMAERIRDLSRRAENLT